MINNFICMECKKFHVCKWMSLVDKFSKDKKDPVGITITIDACDEFEKLGGDAR